MTSYFSRLSPVPALPEYSGPHKVGTTDVELPISDLEPPSTSPDEAILTVQYRIFYPCKPEFKGKSIHWVPDPRKEYTSGYAKFAGASSVLADFISYIPNAVHYTSIPVRKNAPLLEPATESGRWPVMIFSHGLGGTRNVYSQLVGSIASHGIVVICPEHRDGSTPISCIRDVPSSNSISGRHSAKHIKRRIEYVDLPHDPTPVVEAGRNTQLKVRLWEMGAIHDSLLKIDTGVELTNLDTSSDPLTKFKNLMDVHTPGKIIFAGHSFGGATVTQLLKSTFYASRVSEAPSDFTPLFTPSPGSPIIAQITPKTPLILLDPWCFPLRAKTTRWLWNLPLPCYSSPTAPGGKNLLAMESQAFYKLSIHLNPTKRLLSPDPSSLTYQFPPSQDSPWPEPKFYCATNSGHLSQTDVGLLFPWIMKKAVGAEEPERILKLNVRAILQLLRENDIEVADTSSKDMELSEGSKGLKDERIFGREGIRGWNWISTEVDEMPMDSSSSSEDDVAEIKARVRDSKAIKPALAVLRG